MIDNKFGQGNSLQIIINSISNNFRNIEYSSGKIDVVMSFGVGRTSGIASTDAELKDIPLIKMYFKFSN